MILWVMIAVLAVLCAVVIAVALLRRPRPVVQRSEHDLEVFRAQLRELDREQARSQIAPVEAEAARLEIQRRLLAADAPREGGEADGAPTRASRALALGLALVVPAVAVAAYLYLGSPQTPSVTLADRRAPVAPAVDNRDGGEGRPDVETMIARVEQRLAEAPDDLQGWLILARSQMALGRYDKAVAAYDKAVVLENDIAPLHAGRAEALIMQADGAVTEAARGALERALTLDPAEPRARYYSALAQRQEGRPEVALQAFAALLRDAPPDAPWAATVRAQAVALATELGHDPAVVLPAAPTAQAAPAAPAEEPVAQDMAPEARTAMIRNMVAGLAARLEDQPDDLDGWRMLARSYNVLGEAGKAVGAYRRVLALDENDPDALFVLGEAARRDGDREQAEAFWQRLLAQLPQDSPDRASLKDRIDGLRRQN